jgi:hypothetical protein
MALRGIVPLRARVVLFGSRISLVGTHIISKLFDPRKSNGYVTTEQFESFSQKVLTIMGTLATKGDVLTLESNVKTLESNVKTLESKMAMKFDALESKMATKVDSKATNDSIAQLRYEFKTAVKRSENGFAQLLDGLGGRLEQFNVAWMKELLIERGRGDARVVANHVESDPDNRVDRKNKKFELDLVCFDPPIIGEGTTYLRGSEFDKVKKLVRAADVFAERYGQRPELFFFVFGIDPKLEATVIQYAQDHGIRLVHRLDAGTDANYVN